MSGWDESLREPDRHREALQIDPGAVSVATYVDALRDPSWRVRRAALERAPKFLTVPGFLDALIQGLASEDNAGLRNAAGEALVRLGGAAVEALADADSSGDADQRKFIVEALGLIGGDTAQQQLYRALSDHDINVRTAAAEALGRIGGESVADALLEILDRPDTDAQSAAYLLDAVAATGVRIAIARLSEFMDQPVLERSLYPVLGASGDPAALPKLLHGLRHGSQGNRAAALVALAQLMEEADIEVEVGQSLSESPGVKGSLVQGLEHEQDEVVSAAARIIAVSGLVELAPRVLDACACRTNVKEGMDAVYLLGSSVVDLLIEALFKVGVESRVLFLEAIELLGEEQHATELLNVVVATETRTAEAAIRAIGRIGGREAIRGLVDWVARGDRELELQVAHALAELGRRFPNEVVAAARARIAAGDMRAAWLTVLGAVGRREDIEPVHRAVNDSRAEVRQAAIEAAALFGDRFPAEVLILALADESAAVRAAAAKALGHVRSQEAVDALLAAVEDPDRSVSVEAIRSLGTVGGPRVEATLRQAVVGGESTAALAALHALFRLNPPELTPMIRQAFEHVDPEVVREAVSVSVRLPERDAAPLLLRCLDHRFWTVRRAAVDALASRELPIPDDVLYQRLESESEPLVRESLERMARESLR